MDVFDAVRTVLAVRAYKPDPIPDDALQRVLEAGRLTASAMNKQPWHFVVVRNKEKIEQIATLMPTGPYLAAAPVAIVVATAPSSYGLSDASRAIQSMMLVAWADGIGSNWVGFSGQDQLKGPLGIPGDLDVIGVLPLGYPAQAAGKGKKNRKPLSEIASSERYGEPFQG